MTQIADLKAEVAAHRISEEQQQQQKQQQQHQQEQQQQQQQQQSDVEEKPAVRRELKPKKQEPEHELEPIKPLRPVPECEGDQAASAVTKVSHDPSKTHQPVRKTSHGEDISPVRLEHTAREEEGGLEGGAGAGGRAGGETAVAVKVQDKHASPSKEKKQRTKEDKTTSKLRVMKYIPSTHL